MSAVTESSYFDHLVDKQAVRDLSATTSITNKTDLTVRAILLTEDAELLEEHDGELKGRVTHLEIDGNLLVHISNFDCAMAHSFIDATHFTISQDPEDKELLQVLVKKKEKSASVFYVNRQANLAKKTYVVSKYRPKLISEDTAKSLAKEVLKNNPNLKPHWIAYNSYGVGIFGYDKAYTYYYTQDADEKMLEMEKDNIDFYRCRMLYASQGGFSYHQDASAKNPNINWYPATFLDPDKISNA